MSKYYVIYKPYGMLSQFRPQNDAPTLGRLQNFESDVYPVGRLDADSEGLLILTNDKHLNHKLLSPEFGHERKYYVQVDGQITEEAIEELTSSVKIKVNGKDYITKPCRAEILNTPPSVPERMPPVRYRKNIPTSWIAITLTEGKNRQVRKMTAAVGFPTLRLIRASIERLAFEEMRSGQVMELPREEIYYLLKINSSSKRTV